MKEKGICGPGLISAGCYLLPKTIYCNSNFPDKFSIETELIDPIIQKRKMRFKTFTGYFVDIGVPSTSSRSIRLARVTADYKSPPDHEVKLIENLNGTIRGSSLSSAPDSSSLSLPEVKKASDLPTPRLVTFQLPHRF